MYDRYQNWKLAVTNQNLKILNLDSVIFFHVMSITKTFIQYTTNKYHVNQSFLPEQKAHGDTVFWFKHIRFKEVFWFKQEFHFPKMKK